MNDEIIKMFREFMDENLDLIDVEKGLNRDDYKIKYELAKKIKNLCGNINSKVHAYGILSHLPIILTQDEEFKWEELNLKNENGFDLVTNKRIAEFTFRDSSEKSKSADKKIINDLVSLAYHKEKSKSDKSKEFYFYHTRNNDDINKFRTSLANALLWIDNEKHRVWLKEKFEGEIITAKGKLYIKALFKYLQEEKIQIVNLDAIKNEQ